MTTANGEVKNKQTWSKILYAKGLMRHESAPHAVWKRKINLIVLTI